jgi:hydroxyacylglutathione hydrolase/adenylyltransferase/sulfurtransferase
VNVDGGYRERPMTQDSIEVGPERAAELVRDDEAQIVDVREAYEVQAGRLAGSRHIGLGELAQQAPTLDRDRPVVFYCRVGARSAMAATAFRQAGFQAYSLSGGLLAWHAQGRPLEPADGRVADH